MILGILYTIYGMQLLTLILFAMLNEMFDSVLNKKSFLLNLIPFYFIYNAYKNLPDEDE